MPMNRKLYPSEWKQIALGVKEKANWTCQECGRPCRKPGVEWHDFVAWLIEEVKESWYMQTYEEVHDDDTGEWGSIEKPQRFTLTVAHLDHNPANCDPVNLKALCSGCHLRYDASLHSRNASATRYRKKEKEGQLTLLENSDA